MPISKAERSRRLANARKRRYRANKKRRDLEAQPFVLAPEAPPVIVPQKAIEPKTEPNATDAPPLPPIVRPDPLVFNTKGDLYQPSWWSDVDSVGAKIILTMHPRHARLNPPLPQDGRGLTVSPTEAPDLDPGRTYSEAEGHRDLLAEQEQRENEEIEKSRNTYR